MNARYASMPNVIVEPLECPLGKLNVFIRMFIAYSVIGRARSNNIFNNAPATTVAGIIVPVSATWTLDASMPYPMIPIVTRLMARGSPSIVMNSKNGLVDCPKIVVTDRVTCWSKRWTACFIFTSIQSVGRFDEAR